MIDHFLIREDVLVLIVAVLLYATDIARLLYTNEILLVKGARSDWYAITPSSGVRVARRRLVLPRFFDPSTVAIRLSWPLVERKDGESSKGASTVDADLRPLLIPRRICVLLLPQIFVGLPLAYYAATDSWLLLLQFLAIYIQIIGLSAWIVASSRKLGLSLRTCLILAFESLVCIPYAVNFYRKVAETMLQDRNADLLVVGEILLKPTEFEGMRKYVCEVVDDRLSRPFSDEVTLDRLKRLRSRLIKMS